MEPSLGNITMEEQQRTWIPDAQALNCHNCFRKFNWWVLRKHHCRLCGQVFCADCSKETNTRIDHGSMQKVRLCKQCNEINTQFNQELERNQPLLQNQLNDGNRDKDDYFTVVRRESKKEERKMSYNVEMLGGHDASVAAPQPPQNKETITSEFFFNGFDFEPTEYKKRMSIAQPQARKSMVEDLRSDLAQKSNQQQIVLQKFFRMDHYGGDEGKSDSQQSAVDTSSKLRRETSECDLRLSEIINKNFDTHVENMVRLVMAEFKINSDKWFKIVHEYTRQTVFSVKPTSVILNDTIDINAFVKIQKIHHHNQQKCRYINGIVFKKDIANRQMRNQIEAPRILLLANSLGYVQEDGLALVDLEREIEQEEKLIEIIKGRIAKISPDLIFIEKDASRLVLDMLLKENKTVVTNTSPKMLLMIARATQTIICPNANFISERFKIGECAKFKTEQLKSQGQDLYKQSTSLLCLEGCREELGCTILLSGNDQSELKQVKNALRKCIGLARSLLNEREYLKFIKPELSMESCMEESKSNEEEIQFDGGKISVDSGLGKSSGSRFSINDEQIRLEPDCQAPFLFQKMTERQSLIFEHFSLAFPQKKSAADKEQEDANMSRQIDPRQIQDQAPENAKAAIEEENKKENEAEIKRKLKRMCSKPQRQKIDFYSSQTDFSVFTMIKRLAKQSITPCQVALCQKPRVAHTDYWYHGNGCVEIKFVLMEDHHKVQTNLIQKQLEQQQQVLIYAFCSKCQSMIIKKRPAPIELLEMSFFKFLEQFFYNQDVKTTQINASGKPCPHNFHMDSQILFRYGPVKIMFQYEKLEEYTLDLIHFGKTQGIFNQQEIKQKVIDNLFLTIEHFDKSLFWIEERANVLHNWLVDASEELPAILGPDWKSQCAILIDFIQSYQHNFGEFKDCMLKKLIKPQNDELKSVVDKLHRSTQGGRICKLISERICEYIFILKKAQQHLIDNLLSKQLQKKGGLQSFLLPSHDRLDDSFVSVSRAESIAVKDSTSLASTDLRQRESMIKSAQPVFSKSTIEQPGSQATHELLVEQTPEAIQAQKMIKTLNEHGLADRMQSQNTASTHLRRNFKEIYEFDNLLQRFESIKIITQSCAFLPAGYNQGSVRVKPYDFTSMIAMTLNSNLYLSGLAQMDYMEMNEKIFPFVPTKTEECKVKAGEIFAQKMLARQSNDTYRANQPVAFNNDQDVLNQHVAFALAEAELTKPTDWEMCLEFSTSHKPFVKLERGQGEELIINEEEGSAMFFYNTQEAVIELGSLLEQPVSPQLFEHLGLVISQTTAMTQSFKEGLQSKSSIANKNEPKATLDGLTGLGGPQINPLNIDQAHADIYHMLHEPFEFSVKVYYPGHFEALRKIYCGGYEDFIQSFAESHYWKDNSGGKSRSTFFMSSDQKYVMKAVKGSEIKMFEEMSGSYFDYLKESFARQCPTTIAKTLGVFKIRMRSENRTRSESFYLLLMENLLLHAEECCVKYDLKGGQRNRYITKKSPTEVTLDNNFLQDMKSRPIPMQYSMKRILNLAIHNDSLYLSKQSIIDYSMFVIINPIRRTVRLGIIDYVQQYTIEKSIESYFKSGLGQGEPTIIAPDLYKTRSRTAMDKYFIAMMPDRDQKLGQLMKAQFQADKIQWFTKETDKAVV